MKRVCVFYYGDVSVRKGVVIKDVHAGVRYGPGCRCTNCENIPSTRSLPTKSDDNEVEREELLSDHRVRQMYNSELVEDIDGADTTGDHEEDHEDDEENLSEED